MWGKLYSSKYLNRVKYFNTTNILINLLLSYLATSQMLPFVRGFEKPTNFLSYRKVYEYPILSSQTYTLHEFVVILMTIFFGMQ